MTLLKNQFLVSTKFNKDCNALIFYKKYKRERDGQIEHDKNN